MWDRLTPLDAAFLDAEDEDAHASLAIASVAVLAGSPADQQDFVDPIQARVPLVPRARRKLRTVPFDLGRPIWVDDAGFDIGSGTPAGGGRPAQRAGAGRARAGSRRGRRAAHGLELGEAVELARVLGRLPARLVLYAVEVVEVGFGRGLTTAVAAAGDLLAAHIAADVTANHRLRGAPATTRPGSGPARRSRPAPARRPRG